METAARRLALDALTAVEERGLRAREAVQEAAGRGLGARDRRLALELVQGVLRRGPGLDAVLALRLRRDVRRQDPLVMRILRIGAYQLLFLDRVPPSAAVGTAVALAKAAGRGRAAGAVNAVLREVARVLSGVHPDPGPDVRAALPRGDGTFVRLSEHFLADPARDAAGHLAAAYGVPRWCVERLFAQHGDAGARQVLEASITRPPVSVRPVRGRAAEVESAFAAAGVAFDREGPCLLLRGAGDVRDLPLWDEGAWTVQDATAAEVAELVAPAPGAAVLDLCAAPGGKTFALAEAVRPSGRVVAVDLPGPRTERLADEVRRRGARDVDVVAADATDAAALPAGPHPGFDAVLVDAPCSNTGVLAKRVEARRRLTDGGALASLVEVQSRLLDAAATRVRPGGRLVWSTCSVDDEENGARVRAFLAAHADFALVSERTTLPVAGRRDGGYVAVLGSRPER